MTLTDYYALLALNLVTLALLIGPPVIKLMRLAHEGERELEAAKRRIAARRAVFDRLPAIPDDEPDLPEET